MTKGRALVLGAGAQGVCAALALARQGWQVTIVDEAPDALLRASLVNEGKIHLGLVYANDPTFGTPRLMLQAALSFAPLVERFTGRAVPWARLRSTPFLYVIARDSQVAADELFAHYARLDAEYRQLCRDDEGARYLDTHPARLWQPAPLPDVLSADRCQAVVETPEIAVNTRELRAVLLGAARAEPRIDVLTEHRVEEAARTPAGVRVDGTNPGGRWSRTADLVVNCLWSGRLAIDRQLGALPARPWVYRLKYRVFADLPPALAARLPSLTMVLGRYGDIVTRAGDRQAYLSWYPVCLRGWESGLHIPDSWRGPTDGQVDPRVAAEVARGTLDAFDAIVPGIRDAEPTDVRAGVIVSWGATDIDDPVSELHARKDIGVQGGDGYYSIDTGKLTCAPLFASRLVEMI